jgi:L-arabinokinase
VPSVFFYISGHGYGHASREIEAINALLSRATGYDLVIRTSAARWLFDHTVRGAFTYLPGACDTGVVQIDSLRLDARETIARAAEFYRALPEHVEREAAHLRAHDARLVIADAPPLACAAARAAGVAAVVLSNFTWDWIYEGYAEELASAPDLLPVIRDAYRSATEAWRLPLCGGFETFDRIVDLPFIARHASYDRRTVRERLMLPLDGPLALTSFGGYGVSDFDAHRLDCLDEWTVIITGRGDPPPLPGGACFLDERRVYQAGFRYEDVVAAVDAVVTKPGYGIVSECLASRTAMLYTSRGRFVEYDVMTALMPGFMRCEFVAQEDMLGGRWREPLRRLMQQPEPPDHPATNGAEIVADMICDRLDSKGSRCDAERGRRLSSTTDTKTTTNTKFN